jgi:WD40 repeat protein
VILYLRKTVTLAALLFLVPLSFIFSEVTVRSSHTGSITSLIQRSSDSILVSASEDGSIKIWDIREGFLISSIQTSHLGIPIIQVHPTLPRIALVTTDGINTFRLELWDWETKTRLFSKRIEEVPLFLAFSPLGSYLAYGKTDWDSLVILDAERGFEQRLISEGFGIVSAVFITESEKTLLAYSPSGLLRYFDLETGKSKASPIRTKSGLEQVQFSPDGLYLFAKEGSSLYGINLINGTTLVRQDIPALSTFSFDPESSNIAVLSSPPSGMELAVYRFSRSGSATRLEKRNLPLRTGRFFPHKISFNGNSLFSGDSSGQILMHQLYSGETSLFARPRISNVTDFAFSEEGMLLTLASGELMLIESDLFSSPEQEASFFRTRPFPAPFSSGSGAVALGSSAYLVFPTRETPAPLLRFDPSFGTFTRIGETENPVIEARRYGNNGEIILLESSGNVSLLNSAGRRISSQQSFGIRSAAVADDGSILAGRSRSGSLSASLLRINSESGETVPIDNNNILVFRTIYNDLTRSLYTLGYEERRGQLRTVLKAHDGASFERETTLLTYPGEDPDASFAAETDGTRLFTSLGYSGVLMLEWDGFTPLERIEHIPRSLSIYRNLLFSLNRDHSISVWSTENGNALFTFYLFDDKSWAAVYRDDRTFSSPEAKPLLHTR